MITVVSLVAIFIIATIIYIQQAKFGKEPVGARLEKIKKSPNFRDGKFQNEHYTPEITEGYSYYQVISEFFFKRNPHRSPTDAIPAVKTDLLNLAIDEDIMVWFGHSSYFIQLDGKRILVDPVFSGNASPLPGTNKAFRGTDQYTVADLPPIDYLFISHDHYDHTDYETLVALRPKVKKVICGLGVGSHFEKWGYQESQLIERDWNEEIDLAGGFMVYTTPARHFSGRGFKKNNTLWLSYVLQSPTTKIFIGGDSGYDTHYAEIGSKYGPFDLAILDNGQYDIKWRYIHHLPEEALKAAQDLKAQRLFPVHSSKFIMANHAWDEPLIRISALNKNLQNPIPLVTPMIGELVYLKNDQQTFKEWWVGME
ncbi:L-ascorbate metabolism protein UlaG, beta-lactamase superfamily [Pedobacter insulae]|uniref:L-ascorbate metabolism protein UlaG, beta-lactamase superfamily n=2 Tax=Pedobacter insulae TaxID=414048 RepID=A0A1I2VL22_9SPHI|nr:L-ascorbate metabolism protein UlaG, beta-lactamase superfamily [Pedobacter insulae]